MSAVNIENMKSNLFDEDAFMKQCADRVKKKTMSQVANEMSNENEEFTFGIAVMKKEPKPNAQSYHIKTVDDIFQIITPENIDKFFLEFKEMMEVNMHLKTALNANGEIKFKSFDWIDD